MSELETASLLVRPRPHAKLFPLPSRAKQSFLEECDINTIMRKYEKTGLLDHTNTHQGDYGDFLGYEDYQSSLNQLLQAQEMFASIPAQIRAKFDNDPATFVDFAQNPENLAEMRELGLAPPEAPKPPTEETPPPATPVAETPGTPPETIPDLPETTI